MQEYDFPGEDLLSPRERELLPFLVRGFLNKQISAELGIHEGTVKVHLRSIMRKTQTTNRVQLVAKMLEAQGNTQLNTKGPEDKKHDGSVFIQHTGMSLRQYYIGQALAGVCANPDLTSFSYEKLAETAVKTADACLREEQK